MILRTFWFCCSLLMFGPWREMRYWSFFLSEITNHFVSISNAVAYRDFLRMKWLSNILWSYPLRPYLKSSKIKGGKFTPWKLAWQWKIPIFNRRHIFKSWIFHCHVRFPGDKQQVGFCFGLGISSSEKCPLIQSTREWLFEVAYYGGELYDPANITLPETNIAPENGGFQ